MEIAAGKRHSLGLRADGSIAAWGRNGEGQCVLPVPNAGFVAVAVGMYHSLGLRTDGSIVAWGYNGWGQCTLPAPNTGFVRVSAGTWHSVALRADGSIAAWGYNGDGQCNVPWPNTRFVEIASGWDHVLGLKDDGSVVAWGWNAYGQCNVPAPNSGFVGLAAGKSHSIVLVTGGVLPTANAGLDQQIFTGEAARLDGTGSFDDDTPWNELFYEWSCVARPEGSAATIEDSWAPTTTLTPDIAGTYVVQLVVYDWFAQASQPDTTTVTAIANDPPTAVAGPDQTGRVGDLIYLDGSDSFDDNTKSADLIYEWSFMDYPVGSAAMIDDPTAQSAQFVPDIGGLYIVKLIVYDFLGRASEPDTMAVDVIVDNPPTANAGDDQSIHAGEMVELDGSASSDDNTPTETLNYEWTFVETPPYSIAVIEGADTVDAWFFADMPGTYVVELIVRDDRNQPSEPDKVLISSHNLAPTAEAGDDVVSVVGWVALLSGSGSSDPELDPLTYQWSLVSWPEGSSASLVDPAAMDCTLATDIPGDYVVALVVSDPFGPSVPDQVTVTAFTGADFVQLTASEAKDLVTSLPSEAVTNSGNQQAMASFLTQVVQAVQNGKPDHARQKLNLCIDRTDGCVLRGEPDGSGPGRDWILDCDVQWQLYADLTAALDALK